MNIECRILLRRTSVEVSLRLVDPTARRGILSILAKKIERSDTTLRNSTRLSSSQAAVGYSAVLRFAVQPTTSEPLNL